MWQLKHFNIIETENHLLRLDYHQLWTSSGSSNFHLLKNHWNVHNKSFEYDFRNIFIWHIGVFLSCPLVSKIQLRPLRKLTSVHDLYSNSYSFQYLQTKAICIYGIECALCFYLYYHIIKLRHFQAHLNVHWQPWEA